MTRTEDLVRLLTWLSPGFPTGAYAYSHGLEWAVETGDVGDEAGLVRWLDALLRHGAGHTDAVLLRHAHRATDADALAELAELAAAAQPGRERQAETLAQGGAFVLAARVWGAPLLDQVAQRLGAERIAYPITVGALAAAHAVDEDAACTALLHAYTTNLVSAAVRLVPLGQTAGLRTLAALEGTVQQVGAGTRDVGLDEIGGTCFRADIASMRHETQYTRLFRS